MHKKGILYIVSAPSGSGKSTLCAMMREKYPNIEYSISYTTRNPRGDEVNGREYYFVTRDIFEQMISNNEFLEWAEVHGNYYGTSKKAIENALNNNIDIFLDIDPQGAMQLKEKAQSAVFIFITAPSLKELETRLKNRATDTDKVIDLRLNNATKELGYYNKYDYIVINNDKDTAFKQLEAIYIAEKLRTSHFKKIEDFIKL